VYRETVPENEDCCKVGRVGEKYEISPGVEDVGLDDHLQKRWLGQDEYPEMSLRSLVDWFHKHILRRVYTERGRSTIEPHLQSDYEALQNEDNEDHYAVLSDLESDGIGGEELLVDFISPATLHRHLTDCLNVNKQHKSSTDKSTADKNKLEYVESNAEMYIEDLLSAWENRGDVPRASEANIAVRVYLECSECSRQVNIRTVRKRGYICEEHMLE